jgi:hypothetical protein
VDGTTGITPEVNTIPFTSIAWEYGPIAAGALSVLITFFIFFPLFLMFFQNPATHVRRTSQQSCLSLFELSVLLICVAVTLFRVTLIITESDFAMQA